MTEIVIRGLKLLTPGSAEHPCTYDFALSGPGVKVCTEELVMAAIGAAWWRAEVQRLFDDRRYDGEPYDTAKRQSFSWQSLYEEYERELNGEGRE